MNRAALKFTAAIILLLMRSHAFADANSGTMTSTGTIDTHLLAAGTNWPTEWVQFCGYHQCGDNGGGIFHRNDGCNVDGVFCISDAAGHHFARNEESLGAALDAHKGGVYGDGTHDDTAALNATLTAAAAHHVLTVDACGTTLATSADITIPAVVSLSLCGQPAGDRRTDHDYRLTTLGSGVLAISPAHSIVLGVASVVENGTIVRAGDAYAPATFAPSTMRDMIHAQGSMAGTAISIAAPSVRLSNLQTLGFDTCISSVHPGKRQAINHVYGDCNNGVNIDGSPDIAQMEDLVFNSFLTAGTAETWSLDNLIADGSGHYKAVIAALPTETASTTHLLSGDTVYVGTAIGGGGQSAGGKQVLDCGATNNPCTVVNNGTDGCTSAAQCQEAILPDSSSNPITLTATWLAGARGDGIPNPIVTTGDVSDIAVGQTLATSVTCSIGGVTVNAFPAGTTVQDVWDTKGWIIPSAPSVCPGTAQSITATDTAFSHDARGVTLDPVLRDGTCFNITNSGGTTIENLHCFTHKIGVHAGNGAHLFRITDLALGDNQALSDEDRIGVLVDGNHTGDDGDITIKGGVITQHLTTGLSIDSDSGHISRIESVGMGPGSGKKNGVMFEVKSGQLAIINSGAQGKGNVFISEGATYRALYPDKGNEGTGYQANDIITATGGTCTTAGQMTVDGVDANGAVTKSHPSLQGVCSVWPANPISTTGGHGTGLKLDTEGFVAASVSAANMMTPQGDWYTEVAYSPVLNGINNLCAIGVCNSSSGTNFSGISFGGTAPTVNGAGSGATVEGNDIVGRVHLGTAPAGDQFALVFHTAKANKPVCRFTDETTLANNPIAALSPTANGVLAVTGGLFQAGDDIAYECTNFTGSTLVAGTTYLLNENGARLTAEDSTPLTAE